MLHGSHAACATRFARHFCKLAGYWQAASTHRAQCQEQALRKQAASACEHVANKLRARCIRYEHWLAAQPHLLLPTKPLAGSMLVAYINYALAFCPSATAPGPPAAKGTQQPPTRDPSMLDQTPRFGTCDLQRSTLSAASCGHVARSCLACASLTQQPGSAQHGTE